MARQVFTDLGGPSHSTKIIRRLEIYVFPWPGHRPIRSITAPELLTVLRRIEAKGALETAHRTQQTCGQVFRYAIATGRAERDPASDLRGAIPPANSKHFAAITDPKEIAGLLRSIDGYRGSIVVRCALQLAPLVFIRPGELRHAEWSEKVCAMYLEIKHTFIILKSYFYFYTPVSYQTQEGIILTTDRHFLMSYALPFS